MLLVIDWSGVGLKTLQFILSFSILVTLHELGHFITARWFKCRVDKFYLFFNPWFSVVKKKIGETEYGLGWIPFGGYVKIAGMVDESMDKEQLQLPPQPYEFRSKPAWQRLIIMVGGVVLNVLLALLLFILITYTWGEETLPAKNLKYGVYADSLARKVGIMDGDNIVAIDNKPVENFGTVAADIILTDAKTLQIQRNGKQLNLALPDDFIKILNKNKLEGFVDVRIPVKVDSVLPAAQFTQGNLLKGDKIVAFNNHPVNFYNEFNDLKKGMKNVEVPLKVMRDGKTVNLKVKLNDKGLVGFVPANAAELFGTETRRYSFLESVPKGINRCFSTLGKYVTGLKQIFSGKVNASDSLGSVISIGNTFPGIWDWERFWTLTAIFSIILAFMNILPIPALDGGHALFCIYEMVTGRKPSDKFMEYAQMVGMILLFALMAYALGLDIFRLFK